MRHADEEPRREEEGGQLCRCENAGAPECQNHGLVGKLDGNLHKVDSSCPWLMIRIRSFRGTLSELTIHKQQSHEGGLHTKLRGLAVEA